MEEWSDEDRLRFEKESLGLFLSSHPLLRFRQAMERLNLSTLENCQEMAAKSEIKTAVLITGRKEHLTKKGKMAFLTVEDLTGSMEVIVFSNVYTEAKTLLESDEPLLLKGRVEVADAFGDEEAKEVKLMAEEFLLLNDAMNNATAPLRLDIFSSRLENGGVQELKKLLEEYKGSTKITLRIHSPQSCCLVELGPHYTVTPGPDFDAAFQAFSGNGKTSEQSV